MGSRGFFCGLAIATLLAAAAGRAADPIEPSASSTSREDSSGASRDSLGNPTAPFAPSQVLVLKPPRRFGHTAIYDLIRERMVIFGGVGGYDDIWTLPLANPSGWAPIPVSGPRLSRGGHSAIYDPVRDRMLVFGGAGGNDTWALPMGPNPSWSQLAVTGALPPGRGLHSAVYDPVRDRMIVFGGYSGFGYLNDVWALSLSGTPAWTQITPGGAAPIPRREHLAIYDPVRDRMIVFGGDINGLRNDTWALSLSGVPAWSQLQPGGILPSYRKASAGIYDPAGDRLVLFGGYDNNYRGDSWSLTLSGTPAWTQLTTGTPPPGRLLHSGIHDSPRARMVVFGGNADGDLNDTWALSLAPSPVWSLLQPGDPEPVAPVPAFPEVVSGIPTTLHIGDTFTMTVTVSNNGTASDEGWISVSFPMLSDPGDGPLVGSNSTGDSPGFVKILPGAPTRDAYCQATFSPYLDARYVDDSWTPFGSEVNTFTLTVEPKSIGPFYVDVHSVMHQTGGATCGYSAGRPEGGVSAVSTLGWEVKRFTVNVVEQPVRPKPVFTAAVSPVPSSIRLGEVFSVSVSVRNDGLHSDDGRISVSFPAFGSAADSQWVSSGSGGDAPGYLEHPAASTLANVSCQPMTATYLVVEYGDGDWQERGAETNTLLVTVAPRATGTFYFYVRSTMHNAGGPTCDLASEVPAQGESGFTDQQGFPVRRFAVFVLPPLPAPEISNVSILLHSPVPLGATFTMTVTAANRGGFSDDGRVCVSFPDLTRYEDIYRVSSSYIEDSPGFRQFPVGSVLPDSSCNSVVSTYTMTDYADDSWLGSSAESNMAYFNIRPRSPGTFTMYVRSTMHSPGTGPCVQVSGVPLAGTAAIDQQGYAVKAFTVQVTPPPNPFPDPVFDPPIAIPSQIVLGQSFKFTTSVRNDGYDSDDGRITVSFPELTDPGDGELVTIPQYWVQPWAHFPAGSTLPDANCEPVTLSYLALEFRIDEWRGLAGGNVTRTGDFTVRPERAGPFHFYVRSTMHKLDQPPCDFVNGLPTNGEPGFVDQQGWLVKRFTVNVLDAPTATLVSLAGVETAPDLVRLTWWAENASLLTATVYRRRDSDGEWASLGRAVAVGDKRLVYEDRSAVPGTGYHYRLGIWEGGSEILLDVVPVTVPMRSELELVGVESNPTHGELVVLFSLPGAEPADLELYDLRGRRIIRREVGPMGAGMHRLTLAAGGTLPSGLYLLRLSQGGRVLHAKAAVAR